MKKLTKAQKAQYPAFIVYIDTTVQGEKNTGHSIFCKAMEETNLLDAMKRVEACIKERHEDIYLVDIYAKTDETNEIGEPIYKSAIMTRVHSEYGEAQASQWHFRDKEHGETDHGACIWIPFGDRNGTLQGVSE